MILHSEVTTSAGPITAAFALQEFLAGGGLLATHPLLDPVVLNALLAVLDTPGTLAALIAAGDLPAEVTPAAAALLAELALEAPEQLAAFELELAALVVSYLRSCFRSLPLKLPCRISSLATLLFHLEMCRPLPVL